MTNLHKQALRFFVLILVIEVALVAAAMLIVPTQAKAHIPDQVACEISWQQATAGEKWQAKQLCIAAQRRHASYHRLAQRTRACVRMEGGMGYGLCRAVAHVKPAWATDPNYHEIIRRESGWSTNAVNESSGACGAFQRLKCPWRYHGGSSSASDDRVYSTAMQQTRNGVSYIEGRYGSPAAAVAFHNANNWY